VAGCWVFGYGSLVSPESFGATLGRELRPGVDLRRAELAGFGRRWNYGVRHTVGTSPEPDGSSRIWTIVALGLVAADAEVVNGVVGWVDDVELVGLDRRERHYDRVDVTDRVVADGAVSGPIVTYVPQPAAEHHFEAARAEGRAAIERRYWDLVDGAFAALGADQHAAYHATTPDPGVPIVGLERRPAS
jgi:dephospho-CoA kinase